MRRIFSSCGFFVEKVKDFQRCKLFHLDMAWGWVIGTPKNAQKYNDLCHSGRQKNISFKSEIGFSEIKIKIEIVYVI